MTDRSVMLSIKPEYCELIANGQKTIELRKTKPKIQTPFKCYIYCTKSKSHYASGHIGRADDELHKLPNGQIKFGSGIELMLHNDFTSSTFLNGKVIGEFVCDKIVPVSVYYSDTNSPIANKEFPFFCLTDKEIMDYLGNGVQGWGWHISDFVLYDEPKDITNFWNNDKCPYNSDTGCIYEYHCYRSGKIKRCGSKLSRPPQSWCYTGGA